MIYDVVQGDTKRIKAKLTHDFSGITETPEVTPITEYPRGNSPQFGFGSPEVSIGDGCAHVSVEISVPTNADVASYPLQWVITAGNTVCTLPCDPDCLNVCAKVA